jgi:hypothetical protein
MGCAHQARRTEKPARHGNVEKLPPVRPPDIRLRYGQVLWLLTQLGYSAGVRRDTLHEYVRALRKLGIPFGTLKFQTEQGRRLAEYSYCHLMEVTIVLSLRVYHVIPDAVLKGVIRYRHQLNRLYRQAYKQRCSGLGKPVIIRQGSRRPVELRGLFLDLNIRFSGGRLVRFGPPKLLSCGEALERFGESIGRTFAPMNLSLLSERVVTLASAAPEVRSGPRPPQSYPPYVGRNTKRPERL